MKRSSSTTRADPGGQSNTHGSNLQQHAAARSLTIRQIGSVTLIAFLQAVTPFFYVWGGGVVLSLLFYAICPLVGIKILDLDESGNKSTARSRESMCWDALLWPISVVVATYWATVRRIMK